MENHKRYCFACYAEEANLENLPFPVTHICTEENVSMIDIMRGWTYFNHYNWMKIQELMDKEIK